MPFDRARFETIMGWTGLLLSLGFVTLLTLPTQ